MANTPLMGIQWICPVHKHTFQSFVTDDRLKCVFVGAFPLCVRYPIGYVFILAHSTERVIPQCVQYLMRLTLNHAMTFVSDIYLTFKICTEFGMALAAQIL